jgi:hypothetical protein
MTQREWTIPEAMIPVQRVEIVDGKQQVTHFEITLADLIATQVLSQQALLKTLEGVDLVMTLNPVLQGLRGKEGIGKVVRQPHEQWDLLKRHMGLLFQDGVPPETQIQVAQAYRAVLTAKVVPDTQQDSAPPAKE